MSLNPGTEGPAWDALRAALDALATLAQEERTSLVELGKAYARLALAMREVAAASGQTSLRFAAAARALDLRTPKSALLAFLDDRKDS